MLDTQTGRLWKVVVKKPSKSEDGTQPDGDGIDLLEPIPYADSKGQLMDSNFNWYFTPPNN